MNGKTKTLVFMGVNAALVCVATLVIRIPSTMGYKNLGDVFVLFAAFFFGPLGGAVAGGIGAGLADVLGGYASYAPFTLVIKAIEGLVAGYLFRLCSRLRIEFHTSVILSSIPAALLMAAGYFLTNYLFLNGALAAATADFLGDLLQGAIGVAGGAILVFALTRAPSIETVCGSSALSIYRRYASRGKVHKKVLIISDLSGLGRCSLAAQTTIIGASGHEAICLPTAVLSAQTGFEGYRMITVPALDEFPAHFDELGLKPDAVLTGYSADKSTVLKLSELLDKYNDATILVDPIMGDNGKLYDGFDEDFVGKLRALVLKAKVITPNLTEACLLLNEDFSKYIGLADKAELFRAVTELGDRLSKLGYESTEGGNGEGTEGGRKVVITGIRFKNKIYNFIVDGPKHKKAGSRFRGTSYSGTGDILSAVVLGELMCGRSLTHGVRVATRLISHSVFDTELENTPPTEGVNYQRYLYLL